MDGTSGISGTTSRISYDAPTAPRPEPPAPKTAGPSYGSGPAAIAEISSEGRAALGGATVDQSADGLKVTTPSGKIIRVIKEIKV